MTDDEHEELAARYTDIADLRKENKALSDKLDRAMEAATSLRLSAERVANKYGRDDETDELLDWHEWTSLRDDCTTLMEKPSCSKCSDTGTYSRAPTGSDILAFNKNLCPGVITQPCDCPTGEALFKESAEWLAKFVEAANA